MEKAVKDTYTLAIRQQVREYLVSLGHSNPERYIQVAMSIVKPKVDYVIASSMIDVDELILEWHPFTPKKSISNATHL